MKTTLSLLLSAPVAAVAIPNASRTLRHRPVRVASIPAGAVGSSVCLPVGMATRSGKPLPLLKDPDGPGSPTATSVSCVGETVAGERNHPGGPLRGTAPVRRALSLAGAGERGTAVSPQFLRPPRTGKLRKCLTWLRLASGGIS